MTQYRNQFYTEEEIAGIAHFCLWILQEYHNDISAMAMRKVGIDEMFFKPKIPQMLVNTAVKRLLLSGCATSGDDWIISITEKGRQHLTATFEDEGKNMLALDLEMFGASAQDKSDGNA